MNKFIELTVYTTHDGSELVADLLSEYSDEGVSISDAEDLIELTENKIVWDYADESIYKTDKTVSVKVYLPFSNAKELTAEIQDRLISLKNACPFDLGSLSTESSEVDGDYWREKWKENFKPLHIGDRVVVVPDWIEYEKAPHEIAIYLDSNMAFGTGEHETTSMCVEFLQTLVKSGDVVLDVGCGSGILGITASKLGAKEVIMTDIDECAVVATERNIKLNKIENGKVLLKNLLDDNTVKGDVVVANIVADVLIGFAPFIGGNLKPKGTIILSGILVDRLELVKKAYLDAGFIFIDEKIKGEWSACVFRKGE